ncbi:MAG TPA: hypothetical protein VFU22_02065 [Roseiflexaceae bacterium]|nr:hypothetical protein [Roseiflexaceae bacterium]
METLVPIIKYIFVAAAGVEVVLILRALVVLARDKARAAEQVALTVEG